MRSWSRHVLRRIHLECKAQAFVRLQGEWTGTDQSDGDSHTLESRLQSAVNGACQTTFSKARMRITVSHTRSKEEIIRSVDRSFDDLFRNIGVIPLQFADEKRSWHGSTLTFSLSAKMGPVSTPIKGSIEVTDRDLTIDADLGLLERFIPATRARHAITSRVRGLLA